MNANSVSGYVKTAGGQPVSGAVVMVIESPEPVNDIAAVTDGGGKFSLSQLTSPGKYVLQVNYAGQSVKKAVNLPSADSALIINVR